MQIRSFVYCFFFWSSLIGATPALYAATSTTPPVAPVIERFILKPVDKVEPGTELKFMATGTAKAKATLSIDDVIKDVPMHEGAAGIYEGSYTIRRQDNFTATTGVNITLDVAGQITQAKLAQPLPADKSPPALRNATPRDGETVIANPVLISATFDETGNVGIDPRTIRILLAGNDITRSAAVTAHFFSYRAELLPGSHNVDVSAQDIAGRPLHQSWSFNVAPAAIPATTTLPLQISSPAANAQVGAGAIDIRGRTAPDAKLDVKVQAFAAIAGFFGLSQQIYTQALKADAGGYFAFSFQPQVTVAGTRYEVTINASKSEMSKELKLVLFQQK